MLNLRISDVFIALMALIQLINGKIYDKCELALELRDRHAVRFDQIGTFVCIAERQSYLNTAALGAGTYYGLYQLSSDFWCDYSYAGKACSVQCANLLDDDITDDIQCVQTIFDEHQRLFNNGFHAWPSSQFCQSQGNNYVQECFIEDNQIVKTFQSVSRQEKTRVSGSVGEGKVYHRCELARELLYQHKLPIEQIATWVCIVNYESAFNTSAIGRLNWDGSEDHGLFQISDIYWCGYDGKACGLQCSDLRDNDISDDVECIKQIHAEHKRISGDGFTAWAVYPRCKGQSGSFIDGCFEESESTENEIVPFKPKPGVQQPKITYTQPTRQEKPSQKSVETGKVYERCELAQELRFKHKIPMEQVATWVCIAKHESDFNTAAIGRLNADGSEDHGLFQISDIYWCSPPGTGTACGVACSKFEDNDISDDVECMMKIFDEHTLISGNGFNAWAVYKPHCQGRSQSYIDGCFSQNDFTPLPAVTQPPRTTTPWYVPITTTQETIPPTTTQRLTTQRTTTTPRTTQRTSTTAKPTITTSISTTLRTTTTPRSTTTTRRTTTTPKPASTSLSTKLGSTTTPRSTSTTTRKISPPTTTFSTKKTTSTIVRTTTSPATRTIAQVKTSSLPPVTIKKNFEATSIKTTTKEVITSSTNPTTIVKRVNTPTTAKPFNVFDLYFNSFPKGQSSAADNEVQPQQKNVVYNTLKSSPLTTTKTPPRTTIRSYNQVGQNVNSGQTTTSRTTRNLGIPLSKSTPINLTKTSVSTGKTTLATSRPMITTKTTNVPKTTRKIISQSSVLQRNLQTKTVRNAVTLKPFNIFDFYLNGYTSKSPIKYVPLQFSDRSTVIIKKDENYRSRSSLVTSQNVTTTTRLQEIATQKPQTATTSIATTTVRSLSIYNYNALNDNSGLKSNRIGRVIKNITPHSFEYLKTLTTPRTSRA